MANIHPETEVQRLQRIVWKFYGVEALLVEHSEYVETAEMEIMQECLANIRARVNAIKERSKCHIGQQD